MSALKVLTDGDPILRRVSGPADILDPHITRLAIDMLDTVVEENAMGLAAPQVGQNVRVIVMRTSQSDGCPRAFVNPRIIRTKGTQLSLGEGCLSVPGRYGRVMRAAVVWMQYEDLASTLNPAGGLQAPTKRVEKFKGIMAVCVQHEIDHLDGILFTDKVMAR